MADSDAGAQDVTALLHDWSAGDPDAPGHIMPLVYEELRRLARSYLRDERDGHTLQPTALVHEAYLRMVDQTRPVSWQSRAHFYGIAARLMRRILVDHARTHNAVKRGGLERRVSLEDTEVAAHGRDAAGLVALDGALQNLSSAYPRQGEVVELKFFGGLEMKEIAEALQVSEKTVLRDWSFAKLWLCQELGAEGIGHV